MANFWHAKGGTFKEIVLGEQQQLFLKHRQNTALNLILAGCLFMGGFFFWGLSVFGRNDKIIFYFSLFCMVSSYRMIGTVIALTASLPKEVEGEVYAAGLTDIIVKPFNPDDLFRVILQRRNTAAA